MDGIQRGQFVLRLSPGRAGCGGEGRGVPSFVTFKENQSQISSDIFWQNICYRGFVFVSSGPELLEHKTVIISTIMHLFIHFVFIFDTFDIAMHW